MYDSHDIRDLRDIHGGRGTRGPGRAALELPAARRTVNRCLVCGSREVRTDEVVDRGWVLLAECRHCDHRWTQPLPDAPAPRGAAGRARSVRPAPDGADTRPAAAGAEVATAA